MQSITIKHKNNEIQQTKQSPILNLFRIHKKTITIGVTMMSTILVIGYLLNNISSPNATMGSIFDPLPIYKNGLGAVNGYVVGSPEVPILGTIMVAAEQSGQFRTVSMGVEPDGKYVFQDLNPGEYMIIAYFPNGEYKVLNNIEVEANSVKSLIFKY